MTLAPMADVTDASFRRIIAKYGKPDVTWTEFVSADGLALAPEEGRKKLLKGLIFDDSERPIVAQFFGANPVTMKAAGKLAVQLGFDGADINMGCPDKSVMKQGAGAGLIRNPKLARELIRALREGAEEECKKRGVPMIGISVKTRIGYNKNEIDTWISELLKEGPDALTVHLRTMKEMSKVPAHFEVVQSIVTLRDEIQKDLETKTLILINGDLKSVDHAREKVEEGGADGAMLGRAIFGNPWLFANLTHAKHDCQIEHPAEALAKGDSILIQQRVTVLLEHTRLFEQLLGDTKSFALMKKHFKSYLGEFPGAKEVRIKLMETNNSGEVEEILKAEGLLT